MKKRFVLLAATLLLVLAACNGKGGETKAEVKGEDEITKVVIGVSPTPHGEIVEGLDEEFKNAGIEVEIVTFDDYVQPNLALDDGSLDLNYFQHQPYLDSFIEEHGVELVSIGQVHVEPLALYSDKYKSIEELPEGAEIIIPSVPTNGARTLLLLESAGLIELKDPTDLTATEADITNNPKNFVFTAIDPANIARTYTDVDAGVINANFAIDAGLNPTEDGILVEGDQSPYANIVVVKTGQENNEVYKKIVEVLNSDASKKFIEEKYKGTIKPVF